jgi:hypothetical protein
MPRGQVLQRLHLRQFAPQLPGDVPDVNALIHVVMMPARLDQEMTILARSPDCALAQSVRQRLHGGRGRAALR